MDQAAYFALAAGVILFAFWIMAIVSTAIEDRFWQNQAWKRKQELHQTLVEHLWRRKKQRMADLRKGSK